MRELSCDRSEVRNFLYVLRNGAALADKVRTFPGAHLHRQVEIAAENLTKTVDKLNDLRYIASHNTDQA